ncbi:unnamed protein product, partial [Rotaria magnacalcarata]
MHQSYGNPYFSELLIDFITD